MPENLARKAGFRNPDGIAGGTWERLLRVLQRAGYYQASGRLPNGEVARKIAAHMEPGRNRSPGFGHFVTGLKALATERDAPSLTAR